MAEPPRKRFKYSQTPMPMKRDDDWKYELILAMDFGTTFSGVAWAISPSPGQNAEVRSMVKFPGREGRTQQKIATALFLNTRTGEIRWGAEDYDPAECVELQRFKLQLHRSPGTPWYYRTHHDEAQLRRAGLSAQEAITEYIKRLRRHAESVIESTYAKGYAAKLPRRYVMSVPAVWADAQKDATLQAAKAAGMDKVTLITEPEAAALFTLHQNSNCDLEVGDAFVVCDAGGGTVDLISYEIQKLAPGMQLRELVESSGGVCGSTIINQRFEQHLASIVGEEVLDEYKKKEQVAWKEACDMFEDHVKLPFKGLSSRRKHVSFPFGNGGRLPDYPEHGLVSRQLMLDAPTLRSFFDPVIDETIKLVREQVSRVQAKKGGDPQAIFLVGGFGSSEYLKKCLEEAFPDIEIVQPVDAQAAIMKGAALSLLPQEASVTTSVSKKHYGVKLMAPYDPVKDFGRTKIWDPAEKIYRVSKMSYYISKGQELDRSKKVEIPVYTDLGGNNRRTDLMLNSTLMASDALVAPKYPDDNSLRTHCNVKGNFMWLKRKDMINRRGTDKYVHRRVDHELTLTPVSAGLVYGMERQGREAGRVEVKYE